LNQALDKLLCETFPSLYRNRNADMRSTCMCWGFAHGDGWFLILWRLSKALEGTDCVATQVKEKFGTLRFYLDGAGDAERAAVRQAEAESAVTCEQCGMAGELRQGGWLKTLCDRCDEARR